MNWARSKHWNIARDLRRQVTSWNNKIRVFFLESLEPACKNVTWFLGQNSCVQGRLSIFWSFSSLSIVGPRDALLWLKIYEAWGTIAEDDSGKKGVILYVYVLSLPWDLSPPNMSFWWFPSRWPHWRILTRTTVIQFSTQYMPRISSVTWKRERCVGGRMEEHYF